MSKKFLKIEKKETCPEHNVLGKDNQVIGGIAKGEIFRKRLVLFPQQWTEWTSECLRQVADKLDELES